MDPKVKKIAKFVVGCMKHQNKETKNMRLTCYQKDGVKWMWTREWQGHPVRGGFLCDDMVRDHVVTANQTAFILLY